MRMKKTALTVLLLAACCVAARAQTASGAMSEEKRRDLIRVLELTKAADLGAQIIHQSIEVLPQFFNALVYDLRAEVGGLRQLQHAYQVSPLLLAHRARRRLRARGDAARGQQQHREGRFLHSHPPRSGGLRDAFEPVFEVGEDVAEFFDYFGLGLPEPAPLGFQE